MPHGAVGLLMDVSQPTSFDTATKGDVPRCCMGVGLHVVEFTLKRRFDSFRAHHILFSSDCRFRSTKQCINWFTMPLA